METLRAHKTIKKWDAPWRNLGKAAGLPGLRFHDLRHTIITELAGMDLPDQVTGVYDRSFLTAQVGACFAAHEWKPENSPGSP